MPKKVINYLEETHILNSAAKRKKKSEEMLDETRQILTEFYKPFNKQLSELLMNVYGYSLDW